MSTELSLFDQLKSDVSMYVAPIKELRVTDFASAAVAVDHAKQVKTFLKELEKKRTALVGPLNAKVKEINAYAKAIEAPLEQAEAMIKRQLASFEVEQEKIRAEAQRKADEERARKEAALAAKQEAERAETESAIAAFGGSEEDHAAMEEKQVAEQAALQNETAERDYLIAQQGVKNSRKIWKCEIVDLDKVPKEFLIRTLNNAAVLAAARGGVIEIPGVRLWQETSIAIGANTYIPKTALIGEGAE